MSLSMEGLFTAALGLQVPWEVKSVALDTGKRRIDFEVGCEAKRLNCPACGAADQGVHDQVRRDWRHLDFFQFEAWLHADVPRVNCGACGKTSQAPVPWAREGSGFTLLFEALALSLCREMAVAQAARLMRVTAKRLWTRISHHVPAARARDDMSQVRLIGIDETSVKKGHEYITVVHDLEAKRLLFACPGRDHSTLAAFAKDLTAHGGEPTAVAHACMDMSAAYTKGVSESLPMAEISFDRFHVIALANEAMDAVRRHEMREQPAAVRKAMGGADKKVLKGLLWGMRKNPSEWSAKQTNAMHWLQHSNLKSARAWRLKQALREVYAQGVGANCAEAAGGALRAWISWAKRCRLEPFKRLAQTLSARFDGVVRGMLDGRSNAYVEAMNGLLQQTKTAARGFRTVENFIHIAYLRMSKLAHLPANPLVPAAPLSTGRIHRCA
ncbi:MAG: ISL3 family transposase [Giesbergeria sp.]|nr:ISL3 family transposase [Giesbergeria sp.]